MLGSAKVFHPQTFQCHSARGPLACARGRNGAPGEDLFCLRYTGSRHVTLSAKLKLVTTPTQAELLRTTAQAYRDALNYTSQVAYEQGKISNAARLQPLVFRELRGRFGLSAQLACHVPRQVVAT